MLGIRANWVLFMRGLCKMLSKQHRELVEMKRPIFGALLSSMLLSFAIQVSNAANATSPPPAAVASPPAAAPATPATPASPATPATPASPAAPAAPAAPASNNNPIGVNYGELADNLPPPQQVVKLLQSTLIGKIRIFNTDPAMMQALANTGIDVVVGLSNQQVPAMTNANLAQQWVAQNVAAYAPATRIKLITVGNEVFTSNDRQLASWILPAMQNIHNALASFKLQDQVKVSTPHSLAILSVSFPPSSGTFRPDIAGVFLQPVLQFLANTSSPFLANAYPYFAYRSSPNDIPLPYALFLPNAGAVDPKTGLIYNNLFAAQIDAVYSAMERLGHFGVPISVTETGWPSFGDVEEAGASIQNAMTYNRNLISHVRFNSGTPLRPRQQIDTFIFALFNEDLKSGPTSERNYGLFRTDSSAVYDCGLKTGESSQTNPPAVTVPSSSNSLPSNPQTSSSPPPSPRSFAPRSWCVAKQNADTGALIKALNYACGEGGADCSAIQYGAPCFYPNDLKSHASYAFNMYYQKYGHNQWNCNFAGTALSTSADPSYGSCYYPGG